MGLNKEPHIISNMFDLVAPRYDLMNDIMTAFAHRYTRTVAMKILEKKLSQGIVLDLATGTGDMGLTLAKSLFDRAAIIGVDFSPTMLIGAYTKIKQMGSTLNLLNGELSQLPIPDSHVDACVISYGIRNVHSIPLVLKEILRVTKPGGRLLSLEATPPPSKILRAFSNLYFSKIAHHLARAFSSDQKSYQYLASSIREFPTARGFLPILEKAGWTSLRFYPLLLGIVTIFEGIKPTSESK
ncbi:MAG: ubiquinone/menaquinone biosynthesis methyltransferase [Candidatus Ranarchaeia archaeon]|jgi:demethylmenaquinone methyltransferase/2-methoxy-6-polyprenyl-1,4-benzoquinol methylase